MSATVERKLTTILCADVCGYSRHMERDEEGTLTKLKQARQVFQNDIAEHSGRVINMAGDALIAEFGSVVQALQCAVSVQNKFLENHQNQPEKNHLQFRVGLNLGDVIIEGSDIFGDGVNIAARLESMAPPGGICISGTVYDHVKNKLPLGFNYMGEQQVKNIEGAVEIYTLNLANAPEANVNAASHSHIPDSADEYPEPSEEEQKLRLQIRQQGAFYRRAMVTGSLIAFLFIINIITSADYLWFIWPAMPMTLVLAMDAIRVFGKSHHNDDWEERKFNELKKKHQKR